MGIISRRKFLQTSGVVIAGSLGGNFARCSTESRGFDIVIRNGFVIDGSGSPGFNGDIGIKGDKITEVGSLGEYDAALVIDARNMAVTPGFINIHTHTEKELLDNPEGMSSVMQGITTEISGQCGGSVGPLRGYTLEESREKNREKYGFDRGWSNVGDFLDCLESKGTGINLASMVGHGTVRAAVIGQSGREPSADELEKMKKLVLEGIEGGAVGFSTGLEYTPGSFAKTGELIEIARVLKPFGLPYATHMRNEDNYLLDAIEEALTIGKEANCPVEISHLKVQGKPNWGNIDRVFSLIETASNERGNVHFDRYPYVAYSTGLSNLFPIWAREGGTKKFIQRLDDRSLQPNIRTYTVNKVSDLGSWHAVMISRVRSEKDQQYVGMRMDEIARAEKSAPYETALDMLKRNQGSVGMVGFGMSEENTDRILSHPLGMVCSDGSAIPVESPGSPHPRSFGAFARVLGHYVREKKVMDLATAIRKMSSMPAEKVLLKKRGKIEKGFFADIAVFDPEKVRDVATFSQPKQYAEGVRHVIVNGKVAVSEGQHTGALAGRVLRSGD